MPNEVDQAVGDVLCLDLAALLGAELGHRVQSGREPLGWDTQDHDCLGTRFVDGAVVARDDTAEARGDRDGVVGGLAS
jgi:hypothetical protein